MRGLILVAALLTSGVAFAVDSSTFQLRDTDDLVRACSVPEGDMLYANATGFCHGILVGAYRYYDATAGCAGMSDTQKRTTTGAAVGGTAVGVATGSWGWAAAGRARAQRVRFRSRMRDPPGPRDSRRPSIISTAGSTRTVGSLNYGCAESH